MAEEESLDRQVNLSSPAKKVFEIYRAKCYLFKTILPEEFQEVQLIKGEWDSAGSERLWTFANANCLSWTDIVNTIDSEAQSVKWALLDGEVPKKHYKTLEVKHNFSPEDKGCMAKVKLTYKRQSENGPIPKDYMEVLVEMLHAVDKYLQDQHHGH